MVVGEQKTPQGFQSLANMIIDLGEKEISHAKVQELSRVANTELLRRATTFLDAGSSNVH
jgi:hypothetical protein